MIETATEPIRRVLVVKLADIGDAIGTLPALRALRDRLPDARIDALVAPGARVVLEPEPSVNTVLTLAKEAYDAPRGVVSPRAVRDLARFGYELRVRRYDAVIFCHHLTTAWGAMKFRALARATGAPIRAGLDNGRGDFLTHAARDRGFGVEPEWAYWLDVVGLLGATARDPRPSVAVSEEATATARTIIGAGAPYIALHPGIGAFSPARQWSPARMAAVGQSLAADGYRLVITGGRDAHARDAADELLRHLGATPALDLTGRTDLAVSAAVYAGAALFLGSDNGMAHLAAAVGARSLIVFGPSNHRAWAPYGAVECNPGALELPIGTRVAILRSTIACSPCFYTGYTLGRPEGCPSRNCLDRVQTSDVLVVANQLLNSPRYSDVLDEFNGTVGG
ncbi:MAG: glycosyltransferase family 9 protein [Thermomicrobia bacterium]|nr:glycosyltransferase family 9 protein [Thermomicrobia bacterium]MCA1723318.1 glycosyltransferase family 9 protein [Thermomicrobia bacterium]